MTAREGRRIKGLGHVHRAWPVLLLLVAAVLVPTVSVLWFMSRAVKNERLAIHQKLAGQYRDDLAGAVNELDEYWRRQTRELAEAAGDQPAPRAFKQLAAVEGVQTAIIYDKEARVAYPAEPPQSLAHAEPDTVAWGVARELEFRQQEYVEAADAYGGIVADAAGIHEAAQARMAQARCLAKAGRRRDALQILTQALSNPAYAAARDWQGRLIVPNAYLMALELTEEKDRVRTVPTLSALVARLNDYGPPPMPPAQRRFLMQRLREMFGEQAPPLPTLEAEELAAQYLAADQPAPRSDRLTRTAVEDVWQLKAANGRAVMLYRESGLLDRVQQLLDARIRLQGARTAIARGQSEVQQQEKAFVQLPAGQFLPDWQVALYVEGPRVFAMATRSQVQVYLWTGFLVILVTGIIVVLVGRYLLRQARLTRLRNDFIATVSHELKTPLASMRALVETLLSGHYRDQQQVDDYLRLISTENERLSRLIDNFLSFSRMERNKRAFEFASVPPGEIVEAAAGAVRNRFQSHGCQFQVEVDEDLPPVTVDKDAMTVVLLNFLDNAFKYSEDGRQIALRAYQKGDDVCLEVQDNGMGMSRRTLRRVFDMFYQADDRLSRHAGGCGLGLSIVKFIVDAHGGTVDVESRPQEGSTFRVLLPAGP
ncbi:MAG: HAMP domain-containing sensor histidine kinase [Candidatus Brocadiia bacterium]